MKPEDAKAIFLLEHCAERCEGYQNDDTCKNCEINVAIKAIDKQIPKKPEPKKDASGEYYVCPVCGVYQETSEGNPPYCINCGQRLLWEVEEWQRD